MDSTWKNGWFLSKDPKWFLFSYGEAQKWRQLLTGHEQLVTSFILTYYTVLNKVRRNFQTYFTQPSRSCSTSIVKPLVNRIIIITPMKQWQWIVVLNSLFDMYTFHCMSYLVTVFVVLCLSVLGTINLSWEKSRWTSEWLPITVSRASSSWEPTWNLIRCAIWCWWCCTASLQVP